MNNNYLFFAIFGLASYLFNLKIIVFNEEILIGICLSIFFVLLNSVIKHDVMFFLLQKNMSIFESYKIAFNSNKLILKAIYSLLTLLELPNVVINTVLHIIKLIFEEFFKTYYKFYSLSKLMLTKYIVMIREITNKGKLICSKSKMYYKNLILVDLVEFNKYIKQNNSLWQKK